MDPQDRSMPMGALACDGCGKLIPTFDPPGMLAAIKGPCPMCGGAFQIAEQGPEGQPPASSDAATA